MLFSRGHREAVVGELGTTDTKVIAKALGEKWAAQTDTSPWKRAAEVDMARFERENAVYMDALAAEADEERQARVLMSVEGIVMPDGSLKRATPAWAASNQAVAELAGASGAGTPVGSGTFLRDRIAVLRGIDHTEPAFVKNPMGTEIGRKLGEGCTVLYGVKCPETNIPLVLTPGGRMYSVGNECYYRREGTQLVKVSDPVASSDEQASEAQNKEDICIFRALAFIDGGQVEELRRLCVCYAWRKPCLKKLSAEVLGYLGCSQPSRKTGEGFTLLHYAAEKGEAACVKVLLQHGARCRVADDYGALPLHYASISCSEECVSLLLDADQDADAGSGAAIWDHADSSLLKRVASPGVFMEGETPLMAACRFAALGAVRVLLKDGLVNHYHELVDGTCPCHAVCKMRDLNEENASTPSRRRDCLQLLLDNTSTSGAEFDGARAVDNYGSTPLHYACEGGLVEVVEMLIERGADVNALNQYEESPLAAAVVAPEIYDETYAAETSAPCARSIITRLVEAGANLTGSKVKTVGSPLWDLAYSNGQSSRQYHFTCEGNPYLAALTELNEYYVNDILEVRSEMVTAARSEVWEPERSPTGENLNLVVWHLVLLHAADPEYLIHYQAVFQALIGVLLHVPLPGPALPDGLLTFRPPLARRYASGCKGDVCEGAPQRQGTPRGAAAGAARSGGGGGRARSRATRARMGCCSRRGGGTPSATSIVARGGAARDCRRGGGQARCRPCSGRGGEAGCGGEAGGGRGGGAGVASRGAIGAQGG